MSEMDTIKMDDVQLTSTDMRDRSSQSILNNSKTEECSLLHVLVLSGFSLSVKKSEHFILLGGAVLDKLIRWDGIRVRI